MEKEINLLDYVKVILKWKRFIIAFILSAIILTVFICLIMPWTYRAETTLLIPTQSTHGLEGLMALSSMFAGSTMNIPTDISQTMIGRTVNFSDILKSKTLAKMIIDNLQLQKYFHVQKNDDLIPLIQKKIKVKEQKGVLKIYVDNKNPRLAADIANYSVIALDEFNKKGNVQFAKRLNIFIREQLAAAKVDLSDAEEKFKKFETQSQMVKLSEKELMIARLIRDVKVKEAIYTMLLQEYEKTKIEEAKEELFFEVLDPATAPKKPYSPKPFLYAVVAAILGGLTAVFLAFSFEYLENLGVKIPTIDYEREIEWNDLKKFWMT